MEKNLTIAHIAPYLPYGLQYKSVMNGSINELRDLSVEAELTDWMRPLLRPLSQLTEEIEHNGERFVPYKKLGWESGDMLISCVKSKTKKDLPYRDAVKLFEWGFDVFSLIPLGLAIEKGSEG